MLETAEANRRADAVLLTLALVYFLLEWVPSWIGIYGYFIDEFYYFACADHLAFGYVDHPPLSIVVLRAVRALLGDSLPALRLIPALAGASTVLLTGVIARRLGAGLFGQALAAVAVMAASTYQILFSFYSMNSLAVLLWAFSFLLLVEIERRNDPRLFVALGLVVGLGLENKHTIVLLGIGLAVGLLCTPARRHLYSRWLWLGVVLALLLALPNLLWQATHDWASLEFYRSQDALKNVATPPLEVFEQQVLGMNPGTFPVWIAGLIFLLFTKRGRPYRHLGWLCVTLLALMLVGQKSRPDRIASAYLILFAAGGALLGDLTLRGGLRWMRAVYASVLVAAGIALAPIGLPLLPAQPLARYVAALGVVPQIEKGKGKTSPLPQWLADRFGWNELVDDVEAAVQTLNADERRKAIIFTPSYGLAAPIELLGGKRGLPPVYSAHNNYFFWGPPPDPIEVAIVLGFRGAGDPPEPHEDLRRFFDEIELFRVHDCEWCMRWRDETPIWIVRQPKRPLSDVWLHLKRYL
jgi:Dolichyl-phosphate-mannose-protein mannosyltransferase